MKGRFFSLKSCESVPAIQKAKTRTVLSSKTHKGFTLVELLVVISIIALLLGILMPSLNRARGQARKIVCKSRMRQWALASFNYAASFSSSPFPYFGDRCLPPYTNTNEFEPWWWQTLAPYLGTNVKNNNSSNYTQDPLYLMDIRKCPSGKKEKVSASFDLDPWTCWIGVNWGQGNRAGGVFPQPIAAPFFWKQYVYRFDNAQLSVAKVKNPSQALMFIDARTQYVYNLTEFPLTSDINGDGIPDSARYASTTGLGVPYNGAQAGIHEGGCNVTLLDGHIEYLKRDNLFDVDQAGDPLHTFWKFNAR